MSDCRSKRSENHKERRLQGLNWSDIPYDVVECIIRHLGWRERFRMRAVCKAWSVPSRHIPAAAVDKFQIPWALKRSTYQLFDPFSGEKTVGGKQGRRVIDENFFGRPGGALTSMYGWVLFRNYEVGGLIKYSLYSPFTTPFPGGPTPPLCFTTHINLISIDADFWVFDHLFAKLYRFDSSEKRWVYQEELNKYGLFLGVSSFAVHLESETSELALANVILSCNYFQHYVRFYGSKTRERRPGKLFLKFLDTIKYVRTWVPLPWAGVWTANDLINTQ
ncbi:hypothetical protein GQ457_13G003720 [Hibiscus cannabinus]